MASQQRPGDFKPWIMASQHLPRDSKTINNLLESVQMASQQLPGYSKPWIMDSQQLPWDSKTIDISLEKCANCFTTASCRFRTMNNGFTAAFWRYQTSNISIEKCANGFTAAWLWSYEANKITTTALNLRGRSRRWAWVLKGNSDFTMISLKFY